MHKFLLLIALLAVAEVEPSEKLHFDDNYSIQYSTPAAKLPNLLVNIDHSGKANTHQANGSTGRK